MKRFANRLREARVAAGMMEEQLELEVGITKSSVSAWKTIARRGASACCRNRASCCGIPSTS